MASCDLYGLPHLSLVAARELINQLFGIVVEERHSEYQGGNYYKYGDNESENFLLKRNLDPFDGEAVEMDFPDYPIILYINETMRSEEIKNLVAMESAILLLRYKDL